MLLKSTEHEQILSGLYYNRSWRPEEGVRVMEVKPISEKDKETLRNRAKCIERVHTYINKVAPALIVRLEQGFKLKTDGMLYQKDADEMRAIASDYKKYGGEGWTDKSSAYVRTDQYSIWLEVTDTYTEYGFHSESTSYYKRTAYIWSNQEKAKCEFKLLAFHTGQQLIYAWERLQVVKNELSQLNDEIHGLKMLTGRC